MELDRFVEDFLSFEVKNDLFHLKDSRGVYYWDIVRYHIFSSIQYSSDEVSHDSKRNSFSLLSRELRSAMLFFRSLFWKGKYVFFISSRNKEPKSLKNFDQLANGTINNIPPNETILIESYVWPLASLDYASSSRKITTISKIVRLFLHINLDEQEYVPLAQMIKNDFPDTKITAKDLSRIISTFYLEEKYYDIVLRRWQPSILFMTQNGIQKGLISAAQKNRIPVIEFQHGIIFSGHMAYTYPQVEILRDQIISPNYLCTLGVYWTSKINMPHTKIKVVGNDYFFPSISNEQPESNKVLIDSNALTGPFMVKFLQEFQQKHRCEFEKFNFIYKLHSNQYFEYQKYFDLLKIYPNVYVTTNEKSVQEWLEDCSIFLSVNSTAIYEALQCGRKVCIYKLKGYEAVKDLSALPNVFLTEDPEDLIKVSFQKTLLFTEEFFTKFNFQEVNSIINSFP